MNKTQKTLLNAFIITGIIATIASISVAKDKTPIIQDPASLDIDPLFYVIDVNHDGYLDPFERSIASTTISQLDTNFDSMVSLQETFVFPKTGGDGPTIP